MGKLNVILSTPYYCMGGLSTVINGEKIANLAPAGLTSQIQIWPDLDNRNPVQP